jgi:hypothetical protein
MTTSTPRRGRPPKRSPREQLLEQLLVERFTPIPEHKIARARSRPGDPDSPGALAERMHWLATLHLPYEPDMESDDA